MEDIFIADRLARTGANENCGLILEEVRARSPDLTKLSRVRIDKNTIVFFDPTRTTADRILDKHKIKKRWLNEEDTHEETTLLELKM